MPIYATRTACRLCLGPALDPILDLGDLTLPRFPEVGMALADLPRAPLDLRLCRTCGLVQLRHTVPPEFLYRQYWYRSSINEAMRTELKDIVRTALLQTSVFAGDTVIDVGANDGYLLSCYPALRVKTNGITRIAFEPALNLQEALAAHAEVVIPDCFPPREIRSWLDGKVKIVTSIACLYDVEDPVAFAQTVDRLLHPEGVWVVQFQDLGQMVEASAFDNICHEHLTYWSLATIQTLLATTDLHVVHAEIRAINGGSLRLIIRRRVYPVQPSVEHCLLLERLATNWQALERFGWKVDLARTQIRQLLDEAWARDLTVDLYGASTKANTLLQYCGLSGERIRRAWERNPEKFGRMTATGIPMVNEQAGRSEPPDLLLLGIWQFRDHVIQREADYLAQGGKILVPLPDVELVTGA